MVRRLAYLIACLSAAVGALAPAPAEADCLYVEVFIERQNASTLYPVGSDPCLTPTSGFWTVFIGPVDTGGPTIDYAPNRIYADIRIPLP